MNEVFEMRCRLCRYRDENESIYICTCTRISLYDSADFDDRQMYAIPCPCTRRQFQHLF
jgi:hypothetical protein